MNWISDHSILTFHRKHAARYGVELLGRFGGQPIYASTTGYKYDIRIERDEDMARPRKSRGLLRARSARSPVTDDAVPDVYREMIRDAVSSSPPPPNTERPLKRRRVGGHVSTPAEPAVFAEPTDRGSSTGHITDGSVSENQFGKEKIQTLYHDTGDSSQSDVAWEEVGLEEDIKAEDSDSTNAQELNLTLNDAGAREKDSREQRKRRPTTSVERKLRLDIHKLHVLCLLAHVHLRNHWCNDEEVHVGLRFDSKGHR